MSNDFPPEAPQNFGLPTEPASPAAVAERLRCLMKEAGGHAALASRSGLKYGTLSNYLAGREMRVSALVAVADAAGVTVEWLAAGRGPRRPPSVNPVSESDDSVFPIPEHEIDYDQVSRVIGEVQKMVSDLNLRLSTEQASDMVKRFYALSHVPPKAV